ncbi:alpha/beta hydrolase, partial [Treponema sp.]|uniref:alpha/beta hydrolase n=1 Tax=Treponema sp. TaxID=166 RepID=UPI00298DDC85
MEEFYFDSNDKKSKLHAVKWIPECEKPVSILQIVHGMAEYIDRYDGFATFLAERGILVVGDDHLGHGKSLGENGTKGYFCEGSADKILVEDEQTLKKIMQQEYPDVPYFIFGHSMGSFITRNYLAQYGNEVQGAVICGTGMQAKGLLQFSLGLTKVLKLFQGDEHPSNLLNVAAFGSYCKKIDNAKTVFDWLSHDDAVVNAYIADPDCGFTFTINGFRTMFQLIFN